MISTGVFLAPSAEGGEGKALTELRLQPTF